MQPITRTLTLICAAVLLVGGAGLQGVAFAQEARPFAISGEYDRPAKMRHQSRSVVIASHGMVATSQPLAAQVGLDILRAGGTAADAAIATCAMMGLVEPMDAGIGGDLFAIYWDHKTQKLYGLNASGRSPYALNRDVFRSRGHGRDSRRRGLVMVGPRLRRRLGPVASAVRHNDVQAIAGPHDSICRRGLSGDGGHRRTLGQRATRGHEICRHQGDVFS